MSFSSPRLYKACPRLSRLRPSDTRPLQPQLQAGQASTRDVLKCALKTVDPKDYNVGFTPTEQAQLSSIFPNGICDYSQPGIGRSLRCDRLDQARVIVLDVADPRAHQPACQAKSYHSMTSSARARSEGGIARPSAFAVLRLMTSSNFVGCSTGRSDGFAPLRILST